MPYKVPRFVLVNSLNSLNISYSASGTCCFFVMVVDSLMIPVIIPVEHGAALP